MSPFCPRSKTRYSATGVSSGMVTTIVTVGLVARIVASLGLAPEGKPSSFSVTGPSKAWRATVTISGLDSPRPIWMASGTWSVREKVRESGRRGYGDVRFRGR